MPLSGKEIEVEEGVLSLLLFVPQFIEEFTGHEYRLHIKKVLNYKHWDKQREKPKR
jgi:hypothetical protein